MLCGTLGAIKNDFAAILVLRVERIVNGGYPKKVLSYFFSFNLKRFGIYLFGKRFCNGRNVVLIIDKVSAPVPIFNLSVGIYKLITSYI